MIISFIYYLFSLIWAYVSCFRYLPSSRYLLGLMPPTSASHALFHKFPLPRRHLTNYAESHTKFTLCLPHYFEMMIIGLWFFYLYRSICYNISHVPGRQYLSQLPKCHFTYLLLLSAHHLLPGYILYLSFLHLASRIFYFIFEPHRFKIQSTMNIVQ